MSELAFDEDGQHFQVPAIVARWRVRRFNNPGRPGGAQVVYGDDGLPLFLDAETTAEEFREAVGGVPGRYRLDGVDAHGRIVGADPLDGEGLMHLHFELWYRGAREAAIDPAPLMATWGRRAGERVAGRFHLTRFEATHELPSAGPAPR